MSTEDVRLENLVGRRRLVVPESAQHYQVSRGLASKKIGAQIPGEDEEQQIGLPCQLKERLIQKERMSLNAYDQALQKRGTSTATSRCQGWNSVPIILPRKKGFNDRKGFQRLKTGITKI
jgi:hypothetical protein